MTLTYSAIRDISVDDLVGLYHSVNWESGDHPALLCRALRNSHADLTAGDGDTLVGLINSISNRAMVVYHHYLFVRPQYQGYGSGKELVEQVKRQYAHIPKEFLMAAEQVDFYSRRGFNVVQTAVPMRITREWPPEPQE